MAQTVADRAAASTYNIDVHSCVRRYNRMIVEATKSQSSGISYALPFDVARMKSYISAMQNFLSFVVAQPLLDCPETGPTDMPLPTNPAIVPLENESAMDVVHLIEIARDELSNSQSSRMPTNLVKFDFDRQQSYLAKILALLAYVEKSEPLDLPESSPMVAMTGAGARGV
jgi:hypothetical protein